MTLFTEEFGPQFTSIDHRIDILTISPTNFSSPVQSQSVIYIYIYIYIYILDVICASHTIPMFRTLLGTLLLIIRCLHRGYSSRISDSLDLLFFCVSASIVCLRMCYFCIDLEKSVPNSFVSFASSIAILLVSSTSSINRQRIRTPSLFDYINLLLHIYSPAPEQICDYTTAVVFFV